MPATFLGNKSQVVMKVLATHRAELHLTRLLSSEPYANNPENRCPPVLDVILMPDTDEQAIMVLPQLHRIADPPFETGGEIMHCIRRCLQVRLPNTPTTSRRHPRNRDSNLYTKTTLRTCTQIFPRELISFVFPQ
jgi:hypothetical protein